MGQGLEKLQELYDQEINFSISCFYDGGFNVILGDLQNGIKERATVYGIEDAVDALTKMADVHYPMRGIEIEKDDEDTD